MKDNTHCTILIIRRSFSHCHTDIDKKTHSRVAGVLHTQGAQHGGIDLDKRGKRVWPAWGWIGCCCSGLAPTCHCTIRARRGTL